MSLWFRTGEGDIQETGSFTHLLVAMELQE